MSARLSLLYTAMIGVAMADGTAAFYPEIVTCEPVVFLSDLRSDLML